MGGRQFLHPLLGGMDHLAVTFEALTVDEGLLAGCARVRPFSRVNQPVAFETSRIFVRFAAVGAFVRPKISQF